MSDMVEGDYCWGNIIVSAIHGEHKLTPPEQALALFKQTDNPPDEWLKMTEYLKRKTRQYAYREPDTYAKHNAPKYLLNDLYAIVKPCKVESVELGKLSNDRYKGWYK